MLFLTFIHFLFFVSVSSWKGYTAHCAASLCQPFKSLTLTWKFTCFCLHNIIFVFKGMSPVFNKDHNQNKNNSNLFLKSLFYTSYKFALKSRSKWCIYSSIFYFFDNDKNTDSTSLRSSWIYKKRKSQPSNITRDKMIPEYPLLIKTTRKVVISKLQRDKMNSYVIP